MRAGSSGLATVLVAAVFLTLPSSFAAGQGDGLAVHRTAMPMPETRLWSAAAFDGTHAYVFGGHTYPQGYVFHDSILRFDPATGSVVAMQARLPVPLAYVAAAFDGERHIYLFGGLQASDEPVDTILRYDPETDTLATLEAKLPLPRRGAGAVWIDDHVYIVGGRPCADPCPIWTFNPADGRVAVVVPRGPATYAGAVVTDGRDIFTVGGRHPSTFEFQDRIVRVTLSRTVETIGRTPFPGSSMSAVYDGRAIVVAGGSDDSGGRSGTYAIDPRTGLTSPLPWTAPVLEGGRQQTFSSGSAVMADRMFVFGASIPSTDAIFCVGCPADHPSVVGPPHDGQEEGLGATLDERAPWRQAWFWWLFGAVAIAAAAAPAIAWLGGGRARFVCSCGLAERAAALRGHVPGCAAVRRR